MKTFIFIYFLIIGLNIQASEPDKGEKLERLQDIHDNLEYSPSHLEALDELNSALEKLDNRLARRVAAIEARKKREEEIRQKEIEAIMNEERNVCEDVPFFIEFEHVCFEDDWDVEYAECFEDENTSLSQ